MRLRERLRCIVPCGVEPACLQIVDAKKAMLTLPHTPVPPLAQRLMPFGFSLRSASRTATRSTL